MAQSRRHVPPGRGTGVTVDRRDWEEGTGPGHHWGHNDCSHAVPITLLYALSVQDCRERLYDSRKFSYST